MKITNLNDNNINNLNTEIDSCSSIGIGGLSGSGKSTFCQAIYNESVHRIITLLPKSEYRFLFPDRLSTNYSTYNIQEMPLVFYLKRNGFASNPRSTLGTHSGLYKKIRKAFAIKHNKTTEFFSFNNSLMWCEECKGRGSSAGKICSSCNGERYSQSIKEYVINIGGDDKNIIDVNKMTIQQLSICTRELMLEKADEELIRNLLKLGLPYLSLDRVMSTLSGGETIRVFLSEFMTSCENALLILDEVSTGLDKKSLLSVLNELSSLANNNQVWFIDHTDEVLFANTKQIYFGPESGKNGGKIVLKSPRPVQVIPERKCKDAFDFFVLKNLKKRNICISELMIPINRITTITGNSGCGKSTLVHECIIPDIKMRYKDVSTVVIGQDRNQSITSKSTISTFLDIKKHLKNVDSSVEYRDLLDIDKFINRKIYPKIQMLIELGLGYLSLDRRVQTLSTGEFQCISLVEKLSELGDNKMLIVLDEPSRGLSQNILNLFMKKMRELIKNDNITILIIEHNQYIINCSDYVIDFKERSDQVTKLELERIEEWNNRQTIIDFSNCKIPNKKLFVSGEILRIDNNVDQLFKQYEECYKGGLLKN